jgi:DNA-binding transcriptional ArsR family regulator
MADDDSNEVILDTIGDSCARDILVALARRPRSVKELAGDLDYSRPTIYRRVDKLRDNQLVRERTLVSKDGNHYNVYECNFDGTLVSMEDGGFEVEVYHAEDLTDRFSELWDELAAGK